MESFLEKLNELYTITGHDWILNCETILTEPVCPNAVIRPENTNMVRYLICKDTIQESIIGSSELVYNEVILRKPIIITAPFTNPDDKHYENWVKGRLLGNNEQLPEFPTEIPIGFISAVDEFLEKNKEKILIRLEKDNVEYISGYISARLSYKFPNVRLDYKKGDQIVQERLALINV